MSRFSHFRHRLAILIASGGGIGYWPKAPGTWGSLAACGLAWPLVTSGGVGMLWIGIGMVFYLGLWASRVCLQQNKKPSDKDPAWIIIDEIAGQWVALAVMLTLTTEFTAPPDQALNIEINLVHGSFSLFYYGLNFVLFRFFDILKPPPIKMVENWDGALGIMGDDMIAGIMAGILSWGLFSWIIF